MKKLKFYTPLILSLSPIIALSAACDNNSNNKETSILTDVNLKNLINEYKNSLINLKTNFTYKVTGTKTTFKANNNSENATTLNKLTEELLPLVLSQRDIYNEEELSSDNKLNVNLFDLYKKLNNSTKYSEILSHSNFIFIQNSKIDAVIQAFNSLAQDLVSQISADSVNFNNFSDYDNLNNNSRSYLIANYNNWILNNKIPSQDEVQRVISYDYKTLSTLLSNTNPQLWDESHSHEIIIYDNDNKNSHNHSHALANMVHEFAHLFEFNEKENIKNQFLVDAQEILNFLEAQINDESIQNKTIYNEFKNDFLILQEKIEKLFSQEAEDVEQFSITFNEKVKNTIKILEEIVKIFKLDTKSIFVEIALANGNKISEQ
ncbi:MAG5150 family histidine triad lipoprotein [Mycoplasmopsis gallinarum]